MVYTEHTTLVIPAAIGALKDLWIRILFWVEDAVLDVVGTCATHDKERLAFEVEDIASHQVEDIAADLVCLAAMEIDDWKLIAIEAVIVLVIAVNEAESARFFFEESEVAKFS